MIRYIIGIAYFSLIVEILMILRSFLYARRERRKKRPAYAPKAAIIAPHYGWDMQTEENVKKLLEQDYAGAYEIFFVTHAWGESGYDESYPRLLKIAEGRENVHALLAPNVIDNSLPRSQKIQNLITAIHALSDDTEVIAFVDADAMVQKDWLTLLVQPLQDPKIGAVVGARFYFPQTLNAASLVEALWVNFQISLQGDHRLSMVWGGSNAIRRELIKKGKVLERWENATIEDLNLTHAVRDLKLKVHFAPDCVAITHTESRTWKQMMEFTNRQMVMTFRMGFKAQWVGSLFTFLPKTLIVFGSIPLAFYSDQFLSVLLIPFVEIQSYRIFALNLPRWLKEMPGMRENIRATALVAPLSMFVAGINALYALFQNKIVWGGVRYEIISATKCRVLGRVGEKRKNELGR
jgi:cellulose synthase/poly-beta-1,6-N-acetylglucosamine synthase-like glycosyltransferase